MPNTDTPPVVRSSLRRFTLWVIYEHPEESPAGYAMRRWSNYNGEGALRPDTPAIVTETLQQARALLPAGRENMGRDPDDSPVVKEHWF